mgnify:CR=1 FL=1
MEKFCKIRYNYIVRRSNITNVPRHNIYFIITKSNKKEGYHGEDSIGSRWFGEIQTSG